MQPGDILVIHGADPGWTPIFVAAGAIILEVGEMIEQGAIIGRELGKPCVAGIKGVYTRFKDGDRVEVDGAAGSLRFIR
ncbi:PEP-utilizing enzyme [Methanocalculus alkaliphilus]|uniref:PEP-utilizing enzyme n=1 Tax=Methanocalculus alkaliphilus TaxID=768730 RepID=UPI003450BD7D